MSYIEPPTLTNLRKRKRSSQAGSVASSGVARLPHDAIDPHSHGPSSRRQLHVAGLSHADRLPSDYVDDFPHRPLPSGFGDDGSGTGDKGEEEPIDNGDSDSDDDDDNADRSDGLATDKAESAGEGSAAAHAAKLHQSHHREARRRYNAKRLQRAFDQNVGVLAAIVQRGLQEAEHGTIAAAVAPPLQPDMPSANADTPSIPAPVGLARAKRAFGLLMRTEVQGKMVDLRRHYLWAMGAELLMREGEDEGGNAVSAPLGSDGRTSSHNRRRRWGAAANVPRVRAYYEDLIQQYPYNRLWPQSVSALTFWPAMAGTEFYSIYAEARLVSGRLERGEWEEEDEDEDGDDGDGDDEDDEGEKGEGDDEGENRVLWWARGLEVPGPQGQDHGRRHRFRWLRSHPVRRRLETARRVALGQVRDLARRMDTTMTDAPYATSPEMLRLRGMLALYMGDLAVATPPRTRTEAAEGRQQRTAERTRARARFERLLEVDQETQAGRRRNQHQQRAGGGVPDTVVDAYVEMMVARLGGGDGDGGGAGSGASHNSKEGDEYSGDEYVGHGAGAAAGTAPRPLPIWRS